MSGRNSRDPERLQGKMRAASRPSPDAGIFSDQISPSPENLYFLDMHMHDDEISITHRALTVVGMV
jgi:hypothetical protein